MLEIGIDKWDITVEGKPVRLTRNEADILSFLSTPIGRTCSPKMILHRVWGASYQNDRHLLEVNISRLRQKLGGDPEKYIQTIRGGGYRLDKATCKLTGV